MNLQLLSTCDSFRFIPDNLYCYRQLSGGTSKFSKSSMKDLDNIKKYQLSFFEQYQGEKKEVMLSILYSEIAGWFFAYIKQALDYLSEEEVIALINDALKLPRFVLAREFYLNNEQEKFEWATMLRMADANEYIKRAKEQKNQRNMKESVKNILKKVYMSI